MRVDYDFYKQSHFVPIKEVAKALGMESDKKGKYLCPCHNDHHPSMQINTKTNRFHCFSCGADGGPLQLVMAINHQIDPKTYFNNPKDYWRENKDCIYFIESLFPGAILEDDRDGERITGTRFPIIPANVLKEIGINRDPRNPVTINPFSMDASKFMTREVESIRLEGVSKLDAADIIINKMNDYLEYLEVYRRNLWYQYRDMPDETRRYMNRIFAEKEEMIIGYLEQLEAYIQENDPNIFNEKELEKVTESAEEYMEER